MREKKIGKDKKKRRARVKFFVVMRGEERRERREGREDKEVFVCTCFESTLKKGGKKGRREEGEAEWYVCVLLPGNERETDKTDRERCKKGKHGREGKSERCL